MWECREHSPPAGGTTWSNSFMLVLFQIFLIMARSSSLACSRFPDRRKCRLKTPPPSTVLRSPTSYPDSSHSAPQSSYFLVPSIFPSQISLLTSFPCDFPLLPCPMPFSFISYFTVRQLKAHSQPPVVFLPA